MLAWKNEERGGRRKVAKGFSMLTSEERAANAKMASEAR
jgi:hypothetical protein